MSNPIIKVKRAVTEAGRFAVSTGAPSTLNQGEIAVIFPDPASATPSSLGETIYVGDASGAAVAVGGSGTFATRQYVDDKVTSVFVYKGKITSFFPLGVPTFPLDLDSTLSQVTGSYYSIDSDYPGNPNNDDPGVLGTDKNAVAISWTEGSDSKTLLVKKGDSIVKTATGWEKFDNVDVEVHGTASEIAVTGDENAGYTVAIDPVFSGRVSTAEAEIDDLQSKTQNIDLASTTAGNTLFNGGFAVRRNNTDNAFSVTPSGEVSIGAPGADIYLNRPTYALKSLDVKGKLVVDVGADPYAAPEFAVKDLMGSEMVNINGDTAKIKLGDDMNPSTEVTVGKKLVVSDSGASMLEVSPSSVILNMNMGTQTVQSWSTFQVKSMLGLEDNGTIALDVDGHLVGSVNSNNGTVPEIRGFVIDGGDF